MEYILRPPIFNIAPHSCFSDAWESFCKKLLELENDTHDILRLEPPDLGADLIWKQKKTIYQCKSSESETFNVTRAEQSLRRALENRKTLGKWKSYILCINMDITGNQWARIENIISEWEELGLTVSYHDKDYWVGICRKFPDEVAEYFNILVPATKKHVIDALEYERYFPKYIKKYANAIDVEDFEVIVSTNRAEVKFRIPFSKTMTIESLLDVMKGIIRLPKSWSLYLKFGTSAAINSLGITKEGKLQVFSRTLGELGINSGEEVQLFIQVVWSENLKKEGFADIEGESKYLLVYSNYHKLTPQETDLAIQKMSYRERKENTLKAFNRTLHDTIWNAAKRLTLTSNG